jgi:predicted DNA-binding transcriptional regulator YafY
MRADRLLSIVLLLQVNRRMTARLLAQRLEVSERTILRDMDALSVSGFPVVAHRGSEGGWSLLEDYRPQLTGLNAAEVSALFAAVPRTVLGDLGLGERAESALLKLEASLPREARRHALLARERILIESGGWRETDEGLRWLPMLLDALWQERQVSFEYAGAMSAAPTERVASPLGLVAKRNTWYLVAAIGEEPRTYRVSRIRDVKILDPASTVPDGFELAAWWKQSISEFREQLPRYYAVFLVSEAAMRWVRYRGWRVEEEAPCEGRTRVRVRFDAEEEALQFALGLGAGLTVLEPEELRNKVCAAAREILVRYG